jgi:SrtB family sortase
MENKSLEQILVETLCEKKLKIATAESCTGGMLSEKITSISRSSEIFDFGLVSYANSVKIKSLKIRSALINKYGAVSSSVAISMARGVMKKAKSDIGVGITGIAGPGGGSKEKPVGTVYISVFFKDEYLVRCYEYGEEKSRDEIRKAAVDNALEMVLLLLLRRDLVVSEVSVFNQHNFDKKYPVDKLFIRFIKYFFPFKGDSFKVIIYKLLFLTAIVAFSWSSYNILTYTKTNIESDIVLSQVQEQIEQKPTPSQVEALPEGYLEKFARIYSLNKDVKGWLRFDGGNFSYPVVQGKDNDYYLNRDYNKKINPFGTPFIDYRNVITKDNSSQNLIVYAHNTKTGKLFGEMEKFRKLKYYKAVPIIKFNTIYKESTWKIVTVFLASTDPSHGETFEYQNFLNFKNKEQLDWYMNEAKKRSFFKTEIDVNIDDKLLTLSTCAYDFPEARIVLIAREVRPGEDPSVDTSKAYLNSNQYKPDIWYTNNNKPIPENNTQKALEEKNW